ncbi:MAG: hypothetical protein ABI183_19840 [Polyangiaceae bacterium]
MTRTSLSLLVLFALCGCQKSSSSSTPTAASAWPMDSSSAAAAKPLPNACDVFDVTIAKKYLGPTAAQSRSAQPNPHESQCQYRGPNGVITVMAGEWSFIHSKNMGGKAVSGIGDEAYDGMSGFEARKGTLGVSIDAILSSGVFTGKAADAEEAKASTVEHKIATDLLAKL